MKNNSTSCFDTYMRDFYVHTFYKEKNTRLKILKFYYMLINTVWKYYFLFCFIHEYTIHIYIHIYRILLEEQATI